MKLGITELKERHIEACPVDIERSVILQVKSDAWCCVYRFGVADKKWGVGECNFGGKLSRQPVIVTLTQMD